MDLYLKAASDMQVVSYLNCEYFTARGARDPPRLKLTVAALTVVVYDIFFLFPREVSCFSLHNLG